MSPTIKDITGQRFGRLIVVSYSHTNKFRKSCWVCKCDCGNEVIINRNALMSGNTTSCGCYNKEVLSLPYGAAAANKVHYHYKSHAKRRGVPFEISKDRFLRLISSNCHYCGVGPSNYYGKDSNGAIFYNGIDRIDSDKGYVEGNVVSCCRTCNYAKNKMGVSEFKEWLFRASSHMLNRELFSN